MWFSLYKEATETQLKNPEPFMQFKLKQKHENVRRKSLLKA